MSRLCCLFTVLLWSQVAWSDITLFEMEARLQTETYGDGSFDVSLLAGGPLGLGGIAAGRAMNDTSGSTEDALWLSGESEVSGVEPTPFFPVGEGDVSGVEPTPFAPGGERVLTFSFDSAGDYSGVSPQPFHVFLLTPTGVVGELLFDGVVAETGSLILTGVQIDEEGTVTDIPTFTIEGLPAPVPILPGGGVIGLVLLFMGAGVFALRSSFASSDAGGR